MTARGGARPGAGRKPVPGSVVVKATLPPDLARLARELGAGNASAGIRVALRRCAPLDSPRRELQVWRHLPTGTVWLIAWQDALAGVRRAASLEDAHQLAAQGDGAAWDSDEIADWLDAEYSAGRCEIVWRQHPEVDA